MSGRYWGCEMEEVQKIVAAIGAVVLAIGTLVARFKGTNPGDGIVKRLATVFDLTQVFDSTRKLND